MFHGVKIVTAGIPTTEIAAVYGDRRQIGTICLVDGEKVFRLEQEPLSVSLAKIQEEPALEFTVPQLEKIILGLNN
jgi:hypothetical protein